MMIKSQSQQTVLTLDLADEAASEQFATLLAACLHPSLVITLSGDLGAGKTTLIRAMLRALGVQSAIKSPTFSLVESYTCNHLTIHHFDLYRIHHEEELEYLGFRDYFTQESICCIEWPENAGKTLPNVDISFKLSIKGAGREMQITALSAAGNRILARLAGKT
ncbi:tRNA (adenosine(37)-N6)-threonylcarbamoyltransferase complex ATPase subunit type 1 TsaE [Fluoribacter dumoffii]|nr:tRNA (adenosine(37)-N6)-threonylcarbamoyltransferase complex ATPase subunit type 1 TsaE [Fluoribacter dumoffii]MCW8417395.1 tRNA (adenosine(37)-N6)-threonylcarbamoyltransferase complex ATPase subunit type 1 TsaE [Fluoribacter dumoffii]MCW8454764.1 tRNA (adenosine(37)-N6)-threonylcarbamoyltransferase complex ATPase subunit type 1 TsaE [Fluoribacter dumoffii]MCW8461159.1 tRNA (adenosine(37)-N6)-threonylcarbamoyltransferase complex ATPase subunit type 1 TsaE [Fluoribacter dumoffii]MCW8484600.1 